MLGQREPKSRVTACDQDSFAANRLHCTGISDQVLAAAVREGPISLSPNTGQEGGSKGFCEDLPSSFSWQYLEVLISVGHFDQEFLLGFGEVTVGKADSSNPFT